MSGIERESVTVRVPASTANMGPGYDCLGMSLDIWNELIVCRATSFSMEIEGEGADFLPKDERNLVVTGIKKAFEAAGKPVPALKYVLKNSIPFARGLGSSSAAIVSGILAGLSLTGHELAVERQEELLQLAAGIEGHPDNVAPCMYGGMQLGWYSKDGRWSSEAVHVPRGMQRLRPFDLMTA